MSYDPAASYYGYAPQGSYYATPPAVANPSGVPQQQQQQPPAAHESFYGAAAGGGSFYGAPAAPHASNLSAHGSYYSPTPYPTGSYDHSSAYTPVASAYQPNAAASAYSSPHPGSYNPAPPAYNSNPSDASLPLPNLGASYHAPANNAYHSPVAAPTNAYPNSSLQPPSSLPLPPTSPVSTSGASWVEEEKRRVEEEMRRLQVSQPYSPNPYNSAGSASSLPPPQPTAAAAAAVVVVDTKAEEERIRREVEAKVRAEEQARLRELEAKLEQERRAREEAENRRQREEEERRRLEAMRAADAQQAHEAQLAAQRAEDLRAAEARMRAENEEARRKMEADYEARMRAMEQERIQREAQLAEEAKAARVAAEQRLMETFQRRQRTEDDKRRRDESDRRTREAKEVERLRQEAEELRRRHEEEVARTLQSLQASSVRKQAAQAEIDRVRAEMEAKFKREEEERIRRYEEEKKARSAGAARWEIDPAQIERGKLLGKGAFGEVFRGKLHGKEVAVKVLTKQDIDEETLADFRREVDIMMNLHHPNILLFMGACTRPGHLTIVTELMPRGSVEDIIHSKDDYSLPFRLGLAKGAALGMNWLHSQKPVFLHLDLKPANLLVDHNWVVKVADFGMSQIKGSASGGIFGSPFYMAPEMLLEKGYDEKVDVYSFGIVLWEIITRAEPYEGLFKNFDQLADGVGLEKVRPRIPNDLHSSLKDLLQQLWDHDPRRRPSFAEMLRSNVLDNVVLNSSIADHQGRAFWKAAFIDRDHVTPWTMFMDAIKGHFRITQMDPLREKCLRLMLTSQRDGDKVTVKQWNDLLSYFGPLTDATEKAMMSVVERVVWLMNRNWFHGDLTQAEAESLLAKQKRGVIRVKEEGFWLVRLGNPGYFVMSITTSKGGVIHHEIKNQGNILNAEGKHFTTWDDLLNWAKKEWKFSMNAICPGSKYETFLLAAAQQQNLSRTSSNTSSRGSGK